MGKFLDLTGKRFGKLTAISRDNSKGKQTYWKCKCDCGAIKSIRSQHLTGNKIVSCGCYGKEASSKSKIKRNKIEICEHFAKIYFINSDEYSLIDLDDVDKIKDYCWNKNAYGYVSTHTDIKHRLLLHRLIMNVINSNEVIDHINHNKLDNRKNNLRLFENNTLNLHNIRPDTNSKSKVRNIYLKNNNYYVSYKRFGKKYYVGMFENLEKAKIALEASFKSNNFIYGGM